MSEKKFMLSILIILVGIILIMIALDITGVVVSILLLMFIVGVFYLKRKKDEDSSSEEDKEPVLVKCPYCEQLINVESHNLRTFGDEYHWCPVCISCLEKAESVSTYPASYQGKIPIDTNYRIHDVESLYFREKENALDELKLRAINKGCNAVYNVVYSKDHDTEGNYVFSIWRASGKAFIKKET